MVPLLTTPLFVGQLLSLQLESLLVQLGIDLLVVQLVTRWLCPDSVRLARPAEHGDELRGVPAAVTETGQSASDDGFTGLVNHDIVDGHRAGYFAGRNKVPEKVAAGERIDNRDLDVDHGAFSAVAVLHKVAGTLDVAPTLDCSVGLPLSSSTNAVA